MNTTLFLSMTGFSLAASISPGPVNVVALSSGIRFGLARTVGYVTGATVSFTLLLMLVGLGLNQLVARFPEILTGARWSGVLFLLYMAFGLARSDGVLEMKEGERAPTSWQGALLQWLNPKAWLASIAGMAAFAAEGGWTQVCVFAAVYFLVCYASIASWAAGGAFMRGWLHKPRALRAFNVFWRRPWSRARAC